MGKLIQDLYEESLVKLHKLGQLYVSPWGDKFRYVRNGASSALVTGNLLQEAAEDTNFRSMAVQAAAAIGDEVVSVTLGGTATTAGLLEEGHLFVETTPGIGQNFRILSHDVQSTTSGTCEFVIDRPLKIALTTTSQVTVRNSPYDRVIQYPVTTQTGGAVGVALYAMTASYYGWIQSGGNVSMLWDNATNSANGASGVSPSPAVAGSVAPVIDATGSIVIGFSREVASVDSTHGLVHLVID